MTVEFLIIIIAVLLVCIALFGTARMTDKIILNKKLKEIDQMKNDFIWTVSHELRTPLTVIRGYTEILKAEEGLSKDGKENVTRIDDASIHLDSLISDIVDVSKLESGSMTFDPKIIDPVLIAHRVVNDFGIAARHKGLNLTLKVVSTANINVDPIRLTQVLKNLVSNGIKYTNNDSVALKIKIEGSDLLIVVSDTGVGISDENQTKIFDKFYRSNNRESRGTGLGLWITKTMVKKMGGKVTVRSKEGVGSNFTLRFQIVA